MGRRGPRKGVIYEPTQRKLAIRHRILDRFEKDADAIYEAQLAQALGTKYLVSRDRKSGKFIPLDEDKTKLLLECGQAETIEVWDRPPSTQAAQFLADRAIDRPTEAVEVTGPDRGPLVIQWQK